MQNSFIKAAIQQKKYIFARLKKQLVEIKKYTFE
jgi:hypothetical protein